MTRKMVSILTSVSLLLYSTAMAQGKDEVVKNAMITVLTDGEPCTVYIDGEEIGESPVTLFVAPGKHKIRVVPDSGEHPELLDPAYAMGWTVQPYRGRRWIGHTGSFVGFNSRTSFLPREKIGVVVLTNVGSSPLITAVPLHVLDCMLGLDPIQWTARMNRAERKAAAEQKKPRRRRGKRRPSHRLAQYVGQYANPGYGRVVVCRERRGLMLEYHGARSPLIHQRGDEFRMSGIMAGVPRWEATFRTGRTGRVTSVAIPMEPAVKPILFRRDRRR